MPGYANERILKWSVLTEVRKLYNLLAYLHVYWATAYSCEYMKLKLAEDI